MKRRDLFKALASAAISPIAIRMGRAGMGPSEPDAGSSQTSNVEPPEPELADGLRLWYEKPAENWLEALPLGNGHMGAMVFGGVASEHLQLNELTFWAGRPHDYDSPEALDALPKIRAAIFAGDYKTAQELVGAHCIGRPWGQMPYQTFGDLHLDFEGHANVEEYRRELDLQRAVSTVTYRSDGVAYRREAFVSAPDRLLIVRLAADKPHQISFSARFQSPLGAPASAERDSIALNVAAGDSKGLAGIVKGHAIAQAITDGGTIKTSNGSLAVREATSVTLLVSLATSYRRYDDVTGDPVALAREHLARSGRKTYSALRQAHIADYQRLFDRVAFRLGENASALPTDRRIAAFGEGGDAGLAALYFQYARYLLISSSRPGGQPATLQGLWNDSLAPPWDSKYTVNINAEMNYWPAESCGLGECHEPLFDLIAQIAETGRHTAKTHYSARGWVCHHNTDAWRGTAPVDYYGSGMWPTGGAWLCTHLWQRYLYTKDRHGLSRHYPIMKGAAEFFLDFLVEEPKHGWLVTCPSLSPEHEHHPGATLCAGPTMDSQILRDLFHACAEASEILGLDAEFRNAVKEARARLAPMRVGGQGQLQEWLEDWDDGAPDPHHRHISHLYGLYPSDQITPATPELFAAARRTLEIRGDEGTGWSLAWKIAAWARLLDGDHAFRLVKDALRPTEAKGTNYSEGGGVYPNLFDAHPPFQIDGNFGFAAGVVEMLLQCHRDEIHLLPALPGAWPDGEIHGLQARGGHTVGIVWRAGKFSSATILSKFRGPVTVRWHDRVEHFEGKPGSPILIRDRSDASALEE